MLDIRRSPPPPNPLTPDINVVVLYEVQITNSNGLKTILVEIGYFDSGGLNFATLARLRGTFSGTCLAGLADWVSLGVDTTCGPPCDDQQCGTSGRIKAA